jgi:UDP-GlcNAc:undecaprenyl-phosphate GlcNAc-1-phosphate transferase
LRIFFPLFISFILSLILVPVVRWVSIRTGRIAAPREDRWHRMSTPMLGGVGIYLAFTLSLSIFSFDWATSWPLVASATGMFLLGLYDDFFQLSPPSKIIGQIIAGGLLIYAGYRIEFFNFELINILITIVWLVGITNAINLIDNMDGLAAGISLIVASFLAFLLLQNPGQSSFFTYTLALIGAIAGFWLFNFPPARIFMGDSGSMFLGFSLAALAVVRRTSASNVLAVLGIPLLLFVLPILDTSLVTITRILRGQSPAQGGRDHTSHRLIAFGLSERQTLLVLYAIAILSGGMSILIERADYEFSLVFVPLLIITLSILAAYLGRLKVISGDLSASKTSAVTRVAIELTYRRRIFEVILDFLLISMSFYAAIWFQNDLSLSPTDLEAYLRAVFIVLTGTFIALFISGVYRRLWEYFGLRDLLVLIRAVTTALMISGLGIWLILPGFRSVVVTLIYYGIFLLLGLAGTRLSFRTLDQIFITRRMPGVARILLYDADSTGILIARWMMAHPDEGYQPAGFLDDDVNKWGRNIDGLQIIGGLQDLERILQMNKYDGIVITKAGNSQEINTVIERCREKGIWVRRLIIDFEQLE